MEGLETELQQVDLDSLVSIRYLHVEIVSVLHQNEGGIGKSINPSTGMDQEIHPCGEGRIDIVKINPSLLRMRE